MCGARAICMSSVELARLSLTRTPGGIAVKLTDWRRDCSSKRDKARKRERKVISTRHNFLLISLPLSPGMAKCQACKLYIYMYACMCVWVVFVVSAAKYAAARRTAQGQGQRTSTTRTQPNRSKPKPHRHLPFLN